MMQILQQILIGVFLVIFNQATFAKEPVKKSSTTAAPPVGEISSHKLAICGRFELMLYELPIAGKPKEKGYRLSLVSLDESKALSRVELDEKPRGKSEKITTLKWITDRQEPVDLTYQEGKASPFSYKMVLMNKTAESGDCILAPFPGKKGSAEQTKTWMKKYFSYLSKLNSAK